MLSDYERKRLQEIEQALWCGDPALFGKFAALAAPESKRRRRYVAPAWGTFLATGAVTCYLAGLVIGSAVVGLLAVVVPALLVANGMHR